MRIFLLSLVLLIGFGLNATAQGPSAPSPAAATIKGQLTDKNNSPLAYATVTLLKEDSSVVNGSLTGDNGNFEIDNVPSGKYLLRVNALGYNEKFVSVSLLNSNTKDLGVITVGTSSQVLDEVQITGERPLIEMRPDKKVFNVEKNITSEGGSATDVLQNVPSLTVDIDGEVQLRGRTTTILIDGKPATLLGGDVATALQSLPASSIESIEVITNPSAKYDATGMSGIINIITKRNKKLGVTGNITLGAGTRDKYNANLGLNLKNEKWNIFLNSSFRQNHRYSHTTIERHNLYNDGNYVSYEDQFRRFKGFFNTIGAEYIIDKKNSITLTQNLNRMQWRNDGYTDYNIYDGSELISSQLRESFNLGNLFSTSTSLNYKHKFNKPQQEITADATYVKTWVDREQEYVTYNDFYALGPLTQSAPGGGGNSSFNGQIDFTTPFLSKEGKLEAGLKTQMFWFDSDNDPVKYFPGEQEQVDTILLNSFNYNQNVHAAYTSINNKTGKFSYQGGLRLEYATYEGTARQLQGGVYTNDFLNLFPSVFFSYELPKNQGVHLSYTRRIDRPSFWNLMPYLDVSNPQDTSTGNPDLIPEFINNVELGYNKMFDAGHNILASVYYQYTENLIQRYRIAYPDGTTFSQPRNLNAGITYGAELIGRVQIIKAWDATLSVNYFKNEVLGTNIDPLLNNSGYSWFSKLNTNVKLPKDFSIQVSGNYEAPKPIAQGTRQEVYWLDVAVKKSFWDGKANLTANVSDIFNTRKYTMLYNFSDSYQERYRDRETRIGNITFSYRFGGNDKKSPALRGPRRRAAKKDAPESKERDENIKESEDSGGGGEGF